MSCLGGENRKARGNMALNIVEKALILQNEGGGLNRRTFNSGCVWDRDS